VRGVERGMLALLLPVAGQLERTLHHRQTVGESPDSPGGGGRLAVLEQIDAPQLDGSIPSVPAINVHVTLARELRLGAPKPRNAPERDRVREHPRGR